MNVGAEMSLHIRRADKDDLLRIVQLLAEDAIGSKRECVQDPLPAAYLTAFAAIDADKNHELIVACLGDEIIGTLQLMMLPHLSYQGSWRAMIESVRIDARYRSRGFGKIMLQWAISQAKKRGCRAVQLTTDKQRLKAKQFYESLGFVASHEGMKLQLVE